MAGAASRVGFLFDSLRDVEEQALQDLGGDLAALKREALSLGIMAEGVVLALIGEFADRARLSRSEGHMPYPSRWRVTQTLGYWIDLTIRSYQRVGLDRRARNVDSYVAEVMEREKSSRRAAGAAEGAS